ncbi:MAG: hypothetical protein PVH64_09545 [Bacillota bacterium]
MSIKYRNLRDWVERRPINCLITKYFLFRLRRWPAFFIKNHSSEDGFSPDGDKAVIAFLKLIWLSAPQGKNFLACIREKEAGPNFGGTLRLDQLYQYQVDSLLLFTFKIKPLRIFKKGDVFD